MNQCEIFQRTILQRIAVCTLNVGLRLDPIHVRTHDLSFEFGILEPRVCEELLDLAANRRIEMAAWDGQRERPYDQWPTAKAFFHNKTDKGYVRISLLSRGSALVAELPKARLGF
jgi:hypothetical protein